METGREVAISYTISKDVATIQGDYCRCLMQPEGEGSHARWSHLQPTCRSLETGRRPGADGMC
jgi:hypothetical protein